MNCIVDAQKAQDLGKGEFLRVRYIFGAVRRIARLRVDGPLDAADPLLYDGYHHMRRVIYKGQVRWLRFMRDGNAFLVPGDE